MLLYISKTENSTVVYIFKENLERPDRENCGRPSEVQDKYT